MEFNVFDKDGDNRGAFDTRDEAEQFVAWLLGESADVYGPYEIREDA